MATSNHPQDEVLLDLLCDVISRLDDMHERLPGAGQRQRTKRLRAMRVALHKDLADLDLALERLIALLEDYRPRFDPRKKSKRDRSHRSWE